MDVFQLAKGRLVNLTIAVLLLLVLLSARGCNGNSTGWIVEGRVDARAPPPCHNLCVHVYREPEVGARLFLAPCSKPNATSKQRWTYDTRTNSLRFRLPSGELLCLGALGGNTVALADCASTSPDKKWYLEGNHIRNGNPSDHLYLHAPGHPPFAQVRKRISLQLFLGRGTDGPNITQFTLVPYSAFDYVSPRRDPPHSDLIENGAFSDIEFSRLSNVIESRWRFSVCSWIIDGRPNVTVLPAAMTSDGRNFGLNLGMGSVFQRVPTSPGASYLLLFRISANASPVPLIKRLEVRVDYSSAQTSIFSVNTISNRSAWAWETKFVEFIARNKSVNVRFKGLGNNLDGVYLDNVQMFLSNTTFLARDDQGRSRSRIGGLDVAAIVVLVIAIFVLSICCLSYALRRRCQGIHTAPPHEDTSCCDAVPDSHSVRKYSLAEVRSLTQNFSRLIGEGGFGCVYLGTTTDGQQVAVKMAKKVEAVAGFGFSKEMAMLSKAHHRFVVNLLGFCDDDDELILLYEYMPNGSLYKHLHYENTTTLSWSTRVRIGFQVAYALEYLHNGADPPILHRDVKSANVLLSSDYSAKIADFGISKIGQIKGNTVASTITQPKGTKGYIDPQYFETGLLSQKSDVYGFGVVLLEMITGRKAFQDSETLVTWVERFLDDLRRNGDGLRSIWHIVDERMRTMDEALVGCDEIEALLKIALMCVEIASGERPAMFEVVRMMKLQFHSYI